MDKIEQPYPDYDPEPIIRTTHDNYEWNADGSVKGYKPYPKSDRAWGDESDLLPVQPQRAWSDLICVVLLYTSAVATGFIIGAVYYGQ